VVVTCQFDDVLSFSGGLAAVKSGSKWGFIDKAGNFIIPLQFDNALSFFKE
jgi:hypothetical protein